MALATTLTVADPLVVPLPARTVAEPTPLVGAVYKPVLLIVPTPPASMDQVKAGCVASRSAELIQRGGAELLRATVDHGGAGRADLDAGQCLIDRDRDGCW